MQIFALITSLAAGTITGIEATRRKSGLLALATVLIVIAIVVQVTVHTGTFWNVGIVQ